MDPQKIVTCDCGFEALGCDEDVVEIMQAHERDTHGNEVSREDVLTLAVPVNGQG